MSVYVYVQPVGVPPHDVMAINLYFEDAAYEALWPGCKASSEPLAARARLNAAADSRSHLIPYITRQLARQWKRRRLSGLYLYVYGAYETFHMIREIPDDDDDDDEQEEAVNPFPRRSVPA